MMERRISFFGNKPAMPEDGSNHTMPKRTRRESMLGPIAGRMTLRKQSTIFDPLPKLDQQVLENLMYQYDHKIKTDDGILRLCKEIKDKWGGTMTPSTQYGLNDAWNYITKAESMNVEFALRSNVTFNGTHDDDSPIHGKAVTFKTRDCLHIKAQFNEDWWIGRVIKSNAPIGFVPTPMKLKKLVLEAAAQMGPQKDTNTLKKAHSLEKDKKDPLLLDNSQGSVESVAIAPIRVSEMDQKAQGPYEAVPLMRPIVLCGPSLRGFEVTDLMHKALLAALKKEFGDKLEIVTIDEKCVKAFHNVLSSNSNKAVSQTDAMDQVMQQVFDASKSFKLLFVDLKINMPSTLRRSALAPILVHIKISNMKILQTLIKQRGGDQKRSSAAQVYAATKLCDLDSVNTPPSSRVFDVVINEHNFDKAATQLITYLTKYYEASRQMQTTKRSDQLLRSSLNPNLASKLIIKTPRMARSPFMSRSSSKKEKEKKEGGSERKIDRAFAKVVSDNQILAVKS